MGTQLSSAEKSAGWHSQTEWEDVGTMHAIRTRVFFDRQTTVGYAANNKVPQPQLLKSFVEAFGTVGLY